MGRSGSAARYGAEFYINRVDAGSGVTAPNVGLDSTTRYLLVRNGTRLLFGSDRMSTFTAWVRCSAGSVHISNEYYLNGVSVPARTPIPSGFNHVRLTMSSELGYLNSYPFLYAETSSVVEIAIPAFFTGSVDVGLHLNPIPTINELSA